MVIICNTEIVIGINFSGELYSQTPVMQPLNKGPYIMLHFHNGFNIHATSVAYKCVSSIRDIWYLNEGQRLGRKLSALLMTYIEELTVFRKDHASSVSGHISEVVLFFLNLSKKKVFIFSRKNTILLQLIRIASTRQF